MDFPSWRDTQSLRCSWVISRFLKYASHFGESQLSPSSSALAFAFLIISSSLDFLSRMSCVSFHSLYTGAALDIQSVGSPSLGGSTPKAAPSSKIPISGTHSAARFHFSIAPIARSFHSEKSPSEAGRATPSLPIHPFSTTLSQRQYDGMFTTATKARAPLSVSTFSPKAGPLTPQTLPFLAKNLPKLSGSFRRRSRSHSSKASR